MPRTVGTKLTQLSLDATDPTLGKSGQIYARVFDENFKLLTTGEIEATLEQLDADAERQGPHDDGSRSRKLPGQDGEYVAPHPVQQGRAVQADRGPAATRRPRRSTTA